MKQVYELAKSRNVKVHLDGARIFNGAAYLNCDIKEMSKYCDTI